MRRIVAVVSLALCTSAAPSPGAKYIKCDMPALSEISRELKLGPVHFAIGADSVQRLFPNSTAWVSVYPCQPSKDENRQVSCSMDPMRISRTVNEVRSGNGCTAESDYTISIDRRNATALIKIERRFDGCRGKDMELESRGSCKLVDKDPLTVSAF